MYTTLALTAKKQSKGRNGWFRAAHVALMNLDSDGEPVVSVDISSAKENRAAPIQLYFTPSDARALAAALLAHADAWPALRWLPAAVGCYWNATGKVEYFISTVHSDGDSWYSLAVDKQPIPEKFATLDTAIAHANCLDLAARGAL